ncbi:hypothetical protein SDC9_205607 [bioreactor metagenome]|uniref:Uncharacterized protein n=1 Tax=bioreactor metagenome TaxID=1076179 RepID=A0A645J2T9_9ZZZZ
MLALGETGEALLHNEGGDTVVAQFLVGHGKDDNGFRHIAVGDKALGPV